MTSEPRDQRDEEREKDVAELERETVSDLSPPPDAEQAVKGGRTDEGIAYTASI